jgi:hypothetical protein
MGLSFQTQMLVSCIKISILQRKVELDTPTCLWQDVSYEREGIRKVFVW